MPLEPLIIPCPGCHRRVAVEHALGQLLQCGVCGTTFFAPLAEPPGVPDSARTAPPVPSRFAAPDRPPEMPRRPPAGSHRSKIVESEPADRLSTTPRSGRRSIGFLTHLVISMLVCSLASLYIWWFLLRPPGRSAPRDDMGREDVNGTPVDILRWTDASRAAQRLGPIKVRVRRVAYEPIRGRTASQRVIDSAAEKYLVIGLEVTNQGTAPCDYRSWYGNTFSASGDEPLTAMLRDDDDKVLPMQLFEDVERLQGQTPAVRLSAREELRDIVVFAVPPESGRRPTNYFRLELPGIACGAQGVYRFEIPVAMIEGWQRMDP